MRQPTPVQRHVVAAVGLLLPVAVVLWPVLADPATLAIGHPANDVWNHIWGYWWVYETLVNGQPPVHTDLLAWPDGGSLWFIDTFGTVLTLPIQALWGPVAAYNAAVAFQVWLCGIGVYALAWRATRSWPGALVAGLAFMTAPHLLGQVYNGISETTAAGWMALALAVSVWALEQPSPKRGAAAGAMLGLAGVANWYYGLFGAIFAGLLVLHWAWRKRAELRGQLGNVFATGGVGLVAMAAVVVGPFVLFQSSMHAEDALVTRAPQFVWMTLILHNMTDLVSLIRPGKFYSPDLKEKFDEDLIVVVYLGHALIWPALASLKAATPRARTRLTPWLVGAALFVVLSLGPYLFVGGQYVAWGRYWVGLPFLFLFDHVPGFSSVSHAYRFVVGATLALCVLLAYSVRGITRKRRSAWALVALLAGLRVVESMALSPAVMPVPATEITSHPVYAELDEGAVLDLPVGVPVLARARYSAAQLVHGQPIPYSLNDPTPPFVYRNRLGQYLIELERSRVAFAPAELPALDILLGREQMVAEGLRWIVLHRAELPPEQFAKVAAFLDLVATPMFEDEQLRLYRLDP